MNLSDNLIKEIEKLSKNDQFDYFFKNMSNKNISQEENELLDSLTDIFMNEFGIGHNEREKVKFIITLGFWSKK